MQLRSLLVLTALTAVSSFSSPALFASHQHIRPLLRSQNGAITIVGNAKGPEEGKKSMERPLGDNIVTKAIYSLEMMRVKASSETPSEENGNWDGEPREWAEQNSVAQRVSTISQIGPFASFKQWIADSIAGDYDVEQINARVDQHIAGAPVAMFSFTTCPFCLKAKSLLAEEMGVKPENVQVIECDEDPEGNAIRAVLGKRTGRTSMPSVWIRDQGYVGGCNDGPGLVPLMKQGELKGMLEKAGAYN
mmetsp:Transcript_63264/g.131625  ORF Transcript_63264/g.131625 Transcript_63264/m.131625 type:complete len:248 (+) Transcript_63264:1-744(+)